MKSKYQKYIDNIEWHIRVNKPTGEELEGCQNKLAIYKEVLSDLYASQSAGQGSELFRWVGCNTDQQQCQDSCEHKQDRTKCPLARLEPLPVSPSKPTREVEELAHEYAKKMGINGVDYKIVKRDFLAGYNACNTPPHLREGEVELKSWIDFENHKNKMTVGCPDEDSEMSVTISHNGRRSRYTLDMDEAEDLNKFLTNHIANYKLG